MKHSTVSECRVISVPETGTRKTQVVTTTIFTLLFSLLSVGFLSAQTSLSSDPNFVYHPVNSGNEQIGSFTDDGCDNAPNISSGDWSITSSQSCTDVLQADNWNNIAGQSPSNCTNTVWTGGFCDGPTIITATQSISVPDIAGIELGFEWFLLSFSGDTPDKYSYVAIDGVEVFTVEHVESNNSTDFTESFIDMSAYAGQTVEITLGNVNADGADHGNVFFGCFAYVCSG
eukprot:CAMPEP_0185591154 /NCGR_PEP_ID=MMETSP0434-20130131/63594_1 /TAXON_ID=626734 ORGANISM="Favella taraikaensis, Strain Fe Narragansett Bay" /NCGR_SAMPLE_ID=MMETSP0434 /ASSEMBLY_ACC=CAM_ASM_000379 /LENGTH=229 /DNA_ID=CAMNT_0028215945 /DNA_START=15 /DNA_END=700 /DNA_ORIENTATION=+